MRIAILSDIHVNYLEDKGQAFIEWLPADNVDVLVVAGDLGEVRQSNYKKACRLLREKFPQVFIVPGNHEYWEVPKVQVDAELDDIDQTWPNLRVLRDRVVEHGGRRFVGSTLWFEDTPYTRSHVKRWVDVRYIPAFESWIWQASDDARAFLRREVGKGDVVLTHHLPLTQSLDPRFRHYDSNPFYLHELSDLVELARPALWVHGHTHAHNDYVFGETRVVSNPRGYRKEIEEDTSGYVHGLVVELPDLPVPEGKA